MSNSLPTLDIATLESVTGGKQLTSGKTGSDSSSNTEISSALTGIQNSLKDLSKPQPSSAFGGTNLMLFAMLAMNRPAAQATSVVYVQRRGSW